MRALMMKLIGVAAAISVSGCAPEQRPAPAAREAPARIPPRRAPAEIADTARYVATMGSIDLFIIRSSELALERSSSPRVREFGSMMIQAHKGTSAQLSLAGRRLNLLPSAIMRPEQDAMLAVLRQAADFDSAYVHDQRAVHQQALALARDYAAGGESPTLRPVAAAAAAILQRHLRMLGYL